MFALNLCQIQNSDYVLNKRPLKGRGVYKKGRLSKKIIEREVLLVGGV